MTSSGLDTKAVCLVISGDWSGVDRIEVLRVPFVFSYLGVDVWITVGWFGFDVDGVELGGGGALDDDGLEGGGALVGSGPPVGASLNLFFALSLLGEISAVLFTIFRTLDSYVRAQLHNSDRKHCEALNDIGTRNFV